MLRFEGLPRLIVVMTEQELTRQIIALRDPMFRFARTLLLRRDEKPKMPSPTSWHACGALRSG